MGDSAADLVVGAPGANEVYVFAVSAAGDVDEAGVAAVSAPAGASDFGRALALYTDGMWGTALVIGAPDSSSAHVRIATDSFLTDVITLNGTAGEEFGAAFAVGDFNGDGYDDLAVGAPSSAISGVAGGSVFVFDGSAAGLSTTAAVVLSGASSGDAFGTTLAAGDFDGDGDADLAVGAPAEGGDSGAVYVHAGGPSGPDTVAVWAETGGAGEEVGRDLTAGDGDADGYDDLYISAASYDEPSVASGGAAGLSALASGPDWYWSSPVLGPLADADGDGLAEVPYFFWYEDLITDPYCAEWRVIGADWGGEFASPELVALAPGGDHQAGVGAWLWVGEATDEGRVWRVDVDTDADADGFGANLVGQWADCDDADGSVHPLAVDVPGDGTDQDCDGTDATWTSETRSCVTLSTFAEAKEWSADPLLERSEVDTLLTAARAEVEAAGTATEVVRMHEGTEDTTQAWELAGNLAGTFVEDETVSEHWDVDDLDCWDWDQAYVDEQFRLEWEAPSTLGLTALTARRAGGLAHSAGTSVYSYTAYAYTSEGVAWSGSEAATAFRQDVSWSRAFLNSYSAYEEEETETLSEELGSCSLDYEYSFSDPGYIVVAYEYWTFVTAGGTLEVRSMLTENDCESAPGYALGSKDGGTWTLLDEGTWETVAGTDADADGWPLEAGDCDDADPLVRPCADPINNCADNDCDGEIDYFDTDHDGTGDCDDCAPSDARYAVHRSWYGPDADGDGFGVAEVAVDCMPPAGAVAETGDCDDTNALISPVGEEDCNGLDDDCNGATDEASADTWYVDDDGDGWGAVAGPACGGALEAGDCDDTDTAVHPTAEDAPDDGIDADCNGEDPTAIEGETAEEEPKEPPSRPKEEPREAPDATCSSRPGGRPALWLAAPLMLLLRRRR